MDCTSWHSYPAIFNIGHRAVSDFLKLPVLVEEKIDGSQFSAGRFEGELRVRSKGKEFPYDAPEKMFQKAVDAVSGLDLHDGWTYRGEYLSKSKHNTLCYDRVPANHVILFDINPAEEEYLPYEAKQAEAKRLGLEVVPRLYEGIVDVDILHELLLTDSVLGNTKIEGVVLKNYTVFGQDKKVLMAKFVSEAFKEKHSTEWKKSNPGGQDVIVNLATQLKTDARWKKAIQHLRELGEIEDSPRDIGKLLKAIGEDVHKEEAEWIKDQVFRWAWPKIQRMITNGFPEWYKEQLLIGAFEPTVTKLAMVDSNTIDGGKEH